MPVAIIVGFTLVAVATAFLGSNSDEVGVLLSSVPEVYLPIAAGLVAAAVVSREPAVDLHLTLKTSYRRTLARRLALLVVCTALVSAVWALALHILGLWMWPGGFLFSQLGWIAPLFWFVSAAVLLTLLLRSFVASGAILGGLWLFQHLLGGLFFAFGSLVPLFLFPMNYYRPEVAEAFGENYWVSGWIVKGVLALIMMLGSALLLGNNERLANKDGNG